MKYVAVLLALASYAAAQQVKACGGKAQACIDDAVKKSGICQLGDWACGCKNMDAIQAGAVSCVLAACGAEAASVLTEVKEICENLPTTPPPTDTTPPPPTDSGEPEEPEEPAPTGGSPAPTGVAPPKTTPSADCKCPPSGSAPSAGSGSGSTVAPAPKPTTTRVTAGAAVAGPAGALALGLAALVL